MPGYVLPAGWTIGTLIAASMEKPAALVRSSHCRIKRDVHESLFRSGHSDRVAVRRGPGAHSPSRVAGPAVSEEIRLIVVTKGHPLVTIRAVIEAGAQTLGENYPEEGAAKAQMLKGTYEVEWHMIGHVQSRKARLVCENYAWVHSMDSYKIAQKLELAAAEQGTKLPALLECNTSGEESKFGFQVWDESTWEGAGNNPGTDLAAPTYSSVRIDDHGAIRTRTRSGAALFQPPSPIERISGGSIPRNAMGASIHGDER